MDERTGEYTIRPALEEDIEAIATLKFKGDEYHSQFDLWPSECDMDEARARIKNYFEDEKASVFVAADDSGQLLGFILAGIMERPTRHTDFKHVGLIDLIYVEPGHWRKGIGTNLVKHAIDNFELKEIKHVTLRVVIYNEQGINFWESLSFETKILMKATTIENVKKRL